MENKFRVGEQVKTYRAFEGYCGVGVVLDIRLTGMYPVYIVKLLDGIYLGEDVVCIGYVSEYDLRKLDRGENNR